MARFPNNAALLVASANVHIVVRHDGQAARTQLQLAVKASPSLIERYFIFAVGGPLAAALCRLGSFPNHMLLHPARVQHAGPQLR